MVHLHEVSGGVMGSLHHQIPLSDRYSDRKCTPEETWARIQPLLIDYGVTRLARVTGLDNIGIPVWNATTPNARSIVVNQGKGITDIDAKVSAAMEALERVTAGAPSVSTFRATISELTARGEKACSLEGFIARGQLDIQEDEKLDWVKGYDLLGAVDAWIPFEAVTLDRRKDEYRYCQSSDGLASGNDVCEAIVHALLERIERDAETLWKIQPQNAQLQKCVDPFAFADPVLASLLHRITEAGHMLRLFDITSDIGIPSFSALLAPKNIMEMKVPRHMDVTAGSGAHPVALRAAIRAVTEAAQSRLKNISGARDDISPKDFTKSLAADIRAYFQADPVAVLANDYEEPKGPLLPFILDRLRTAGIRSAIFCELTSEGTPFSVVKVIIPDLEKPDGNWKRRFCQRAIAQSLKA